MLTGELRSKIDNVWNAFWAGGIANPIEVIEQNSSLDFFFASIANLTPLDNQATVGDQSPHTRILDMRT